MAKSLRRDGRALNNQKLQALHSISFKYTSVSEATRCLNRTHNVTAGKWNDVFNRITNAKEWEVDLLWQDLKSYYLEFCGSKKEKKKRKERKNLYLA